MSDMAWVDWQRKSAQRTLALPETRRFGLHVATSGARWIADQTSRHASLLLICAMGGALVLGGVLVVGGLTIMGSGQEKQADGIAGIPQTAPIASPPTAPAWIDIVKPFELYSLEAADLAKAGKVYTAKRHRTGGGRQDDLAFGTLGGPETSLHLSIYRRGTEPAKPAPFFADIAKTAAEAGLSITKSGLPDLMATRFGRFEIADIVLRGDSNTATCNGLRLVSHTPAVTMTALACGPNRQVMRRETLSCLLDRLDLISGGEDRALVDFFAATELKRNATCGGMRLGPDTSHAAWLDDRPATPRRNMRRH